MVYLATDQAKGVTGQFIYASGGDICLYAHQIEPSRFIRKVGKWSVDDIIEVFPQFVEEGKN